MTTNLLKPISMSSKNMTDEKQRTDALIETARFLEGCRHKYRNTKTALATRLASNSETTSNFIFGDYLIV